MSLTKWKFLPYVVGLTVMAVFLLFVGNASATQPDPEHKVQLCHRTASDTNPYVLIEVDVASLPAHLNNLPGHPAKTNADGSPRNDYLYTEATPCELPSASPTSEPSAEPSTTPSAEPTPAPSASPSTTPVPSSPPTPSATPAVSPAPSPAPSATPSPEPSAPSPTAPAQTAPPTDVGD